MNNPKHKSVYFCGICTFLFSYVIFLIRSNKSIFQTIFFTQSKIFKYIAFAIIQKKTSSAHQVHVIQIKYWTCEIVHTLHRMLSLTKHLNLTIDRWRWRTLWYRAPTFLWGFYFFYSLHHIKIVAHQFIHNNILWIKKYVSLLRDRWKTEQKHVRPKH